MNKRLFFALICTFIVVVSYSQNIIPVWKNQLILTHKNGAQTGNSLLGADKFNNSYIYTDFNDTLLYGDSIFINKTKLSSILIKTDVNNELCWMYKFINKGDISTRDFVVDGDGNSYITGVYRGEFQISSNITLDSTEKIGRTFLAKINPNGILIWAKGFSSMYDNKLTLNNNGKLYVKCSGANGTTYQLGDTILPTTTSEAIAKFDTSGKFIWAKTFTHIDGIIADSFENLYLFADFRLKVNIDTFVLNPFNTKRYDIYIAKVNSKAEIKWICHLPNINQTLSTYKYNLTTDNSGNVYYGGVFRDTITLMGKEYYSPSFDKIFFFKLDSIGTFKWVKFSGGNELLHEGMSCIFFTRDNSIKGKIKINNSTEFDGKTIPNIDSKGAAFIEMDTSGYVVTLNKLILPYGYFMPGSNKVYYQLSPISPGDSIKILEKFYKRTKALDKFLVKYDTSSFNSVQNAVKNHETIKLFPNPTNSICYIQSQKNNINAIQMYNSLGMLSKEQNYNNTKFIQLDVATLSKGLYFVKILLSNDEFLTTKIIVE